MSTATERTQRSQWIFGGIFMTFAFALLGFYYFVSYQVSLAQTELKQSNSQLKATKKELTSLLDEDLKELANRYSSALIGVENILQAREEVFSGALDDESLIPVMFLQYTQFFDWLQQLLSKKVVINGVSITQGGDIGFIVATNSYSEAAKQMSALRFGVEGLEDEPFKKLEKELARLEEQDTDTEELTKIQEFLQEDEYPHLFKDIEISGVAGQQNSGGEDIPPLLKTAPFIYTFAFQAKINPEYFIQLKQLQDDINDLKEDDNSDTSSDS